MCSCVFSNIFIPLCGFEGNFGDILNFFSLRKGGFEVSRKHEFFFPASPGKDRGGAKSVYGRNALAKSEKRPHFFFAQAPSFPHKWRRICEKSRVYLYISTHSSTKKISRCHEKRRQSFPLLLLLVRQRGQSQLSAPFKQPCNIMFLPLRSPPFLLEVI